MVVVVVEVHMGYTMSKQSEVVVVVVYNKSRSLVVRRDGGLSAPHLALNIFLSERWFVVLSRGGGKAKKKL